MHIGLTFDLQTDPLDPRQAEFDPPATIEALRAALAAPGHQVTLLGDAGALLRRGMKSLCDVDFVFNIAEGRGTRCREAWAPMLLELYHIPYAGSDPLALMLGLDKLACKRIASACGLITPEWLTASSASDLPAEVPLPFPLIVKPRYGGSGMGVDAGAVVRDRQALAERVDAVTAQWQQPVVIEEFISHGELTVLLVGNNPPLAYPPVQRPLDPDSRLSYHVVRPAPERWEAPLTLDATLEERASRAAQVMFAELGCRDMARVDFRVDRLGRVHFLEINPLPSFDPEGTIGLIAEHAGRTYAQLVQEILNAALRRHHAPPSPTHDAPVGSLQVS
jgi:D-alanine-D-alanine ligase